MLEIIFIVGLTVAVVAESVLYIKAMYDHEHSLKDLQNKTLAHTQTLIDRITVQETYIQMLASRIDAIENGRRRKC